MSNSAEEVNTIIDLSTEAFVRAKNVIVDLGGLADLAVQPESTLSARLVVILGAAEAALTAMSMLVADRHDDKDGLGQEQMMFAALLIGHMQRVSAIRAKIEPASIAIIWERTHADFEKLYGYRAKTITAYDTVASMKRARAAH